MEEMKVISHKAQYHSLADRFIVSNDKDDAHRKWQTNEVQIIVATVSFYINYIGYRLLIRVQIAFGLGIDKHDGEYDCKVLPLHHSNVVHS